MRPHDPDMTRVPHRILVLVSVLVAGYAAVYLVASWVARDRGTDVLPAVGGMAIFTIVGALIGDRRPDNEVGRICLAVGLILVASTSFRILAQRLDAEPGTLRPSTSVLWIRDTTRGSSRS